MADEDSAVLHDIRARRAAAMTAHREFLDTVDGNADADAVIAAARKSLTARAEIEALELAERELTTIAQARKLGVDAGAGRGTAGRIEAARRFKKKA